MAAAADGAGLVLLGVIGRPHGVRGHVHVTSYTADPADLAGYGLLRDGGGRRFSLRWVADGVAEVAEHGAEGARRVADRTAAERLTNTRLFVERQALPTPAADEFYLADLIGLAAVAPDGTGLGTVAVLHDYGAGPSLEIAGEGGAMIVPFTRDCVPEVDLPGRRLVVRRPAEIVVEAIA